MKCCTTCGSDSDKGAVIEYERLRHELTMELQETMKTIKEARADNEEQLRELRSIRDIMSKQTVHVVSRPSGDTTTASVTYDSIYDVVNAGHFNSSFELIGSSDKFFDPTEVVWVDPRTVSWKKTFGHNSVVYQIRKDDLLGSGNKFFVTAVGFPVHGDRSHVLIGSEVDSGNDAIKLTKFVKPVTTSDDVFYVGMQRYSTGFRFESMLKSDFSPVQLKEHWERTISSIVIEDPSNPNDLTTTPVLQKNVNWITSGSDASDIEKELIQLDLERGENYSTTIDLYKYFVVADYGEPKNNTKIHYYKVKKDNFTAAASLKIEPTDNDQTNRTYRYLVLDVTI